MTDFLHQLGSCASTQRMTLLSLHCESANAAGICTSASIGPHAGESLLLLSLPFDVFDIRLCGSA